MPQGDSGFLLTSTSAQDMAILVGPTQRRGEQPASLSAAQDGTNPPKISHLERS